MFLKIRNKIETELKTYTRNIDKAYHLSKLSPVLFNNIKEFISRDGKRIRPILFCIGYLGFSKRPASGLYRSAISLELLHDFMLVHDDIIDKSDTRRGKPSMHALLNKYLSKSRNLKFNGEDLTIIIGDVMYALALDAFLEVRENPARKELALRKLISAALYTGSGEFIELLLGLKAIDKTSKEDIYKIYDYKTANYTFASPLTMGAILAGASPKEVNKLFCFGMKLGRAFQIKDDIIGTFCESADIGKSNLTDLAEARKTLLIWHAYNYCKKKDKKIIMRILNKHNVGKNQLLKIRKILLDSGSLSFAKKEIGILLSKAKDTLKSSKMNKNCRQALINFSNKILEI